MPRQLRATGTGSSGRPRGNILIFGHTKGTPCTELGAPRIDVQPYILDRQRFSKPLGNLLHKRPLLLVRQQLHPASERHRLQKGDRLRRG